MSRALRLLPIILLVWILLAFAWRLIQPTDPTVRSQLVNREVPRIRASSRLSPGIPGLSVGRSGDGRAAPAQLVRELVHAMHRRGSSARGASSRRA